MRVRGSCTTYMYVFVKSLDVGEGSLPLLPKLLLLAYMYKIR